MKMESLPSWGQRHNLSPNWTLSELDSLNFAHFMADYLKGTYFRSQTEFLEYLMKGDASVWENQTLLGSILYEARMGRPLKSYQPKIIDSVLAESTFSELRSYVDKALKRSDFLHWCNEFNRYQIYDSPYLQRLHLMVTPLAEEHINRKLTPTYSFLSMYTRGGYCRPHVDDNRCQWTLDLCINQNKSWPLYVENKPYDLKENSAVIYSGTDQLHWRHRFDPDGLAHLVFFHFEEV